MLRNTRLVVLIYLHNMTYATGGECALSHVGDMQHLYTVFAKIANFIKKRDNMRKEPTNFLGTAIKSGEVKNIIMIGCSLYDVITSCIRNSAMTCERDNPNIHLTVDLFHCEGLTNS